MSVDIVPGAPTAASTVFSTGRKILLPVLMALACLLLWELGVVYYDVPSVILPRPSEILRVLFLQWRILLDNSIPTTLETIAAFVLSVAVGSVLALAMVYSRFMRDLLYPNIVVFQLIPKIALAPLFILWLGINWQSRVATAVFIAFFPVVISTATGLVSADQSLLRLCRSLGASEWQIFTRVRLPSSLPFLFNGMKISMTFAIIGVIVGEFITSQQGLGYLILFAGSKLETALVMAALLVLCIVGLVLYGLVALIEALVMPIYGS